MTQGMACFGIAVMAAAFSIQGQNVEIKSTHVAGSAHMLEDG